MIKGKKFPKDVIDCWPEVFGEINLNVIPIRYLHSITVTFNNKKVWELKITKIKNDANWDDFEHQLKEILSTYEKEIENVDFKLDTDKIRKDIIKSTKKFLKNRKL